MRYDESLLKFAVSLNWRMLVSCWEKLETDVPQFMNVIISTEKNWRQYLLGEIAKPTGEHHLFVFAGMPLQLPDVHEKFLHYLFRSIDGTPAISGKTVAIYVKLVRGVFYSPIVPGVAKGWVNTRIHAGSGTLMSPQIVKMPGFPGFLNSRVQEAFSVPLSDTQNQKITQTMLSNPERLMRSESLRVQLASNMLNSR